MIAAVKVESSALDSMKEKLREVENLRNQISNFTKRLLDADQANLNLKTNLVKTQEMLGEVKKAKAEVILHVNSCTCSMCRCILSITDSSGRSNWHLSWLVIF